MYEVIGFRHMNGTSKKTGKPYSGFMIWFSMPFRSEDGVGQETDSVFVDDTLLKGRVPAVGGIIDLRFNRRGFLESVEL